jgi:ElaB/YqjD/DUF883 family membrane-anchored ribosome-binding protein
MTTSKTAAADDGGAAAANDAQARLEDDIEAFRKRLDTFEEQLRVTGDRLLENAKELTVAASRQMQLHPLTAFGVAFLAGVTVAKLLRR